MNDANSKLKQQIAEKIKGAANILITVSRNPSVDSLSAALGLAAILNKLGKHATAIFSGAVPPAIDFLEPGKVFENNIDSLRDFIIALDKEKADHLRYKVEGDLVKIFITPYHTTITNDDLQFSHGDFNADLVVALGVVDKEDLDTAIEAHGNILQDVTVVSLSSGDQVSKLGTISWHYEGASGFSQMIAEIGEAMKSDKPLLDQQIATALLTGIVSATDRFSNAKTSSQVMTIAAQLMAAGADQQLIAAKLQEAHEINSLKYNPIISKGGEPVQKDASASTDIEKDAGALSIQHEEVPRSTAPVSPIIGIDTSANKPAEITAPVKQISTLPPQTTEQLKNVEAAMPASAPEPALGGTLSATSEQAAEDAKRDIEDQQNKVILKHSYVGEPASEQSINSTGISNNEGSVKDIFAEGPMASESPRLENTSTLPPEPSQETLPPEPMPPQAAVPSPIVDLPMPPPLPDFSTLPPEPTTPSFEVSASPQLEPNLSTLPPQPDSNDPSQFKIPGQ